MHVVPSMYSPATIIIKLSRKPKPINGRLWQSASFFRSLQVGLFSEISLDGKVPASSLSLNILNSKILSSLLRSLTILRARVPFGVKWHFWPRQRHDTLMGLWLCFSNDLDKVKRTMAKLLVKWIVDQVGLLQHAISPSREICVAMTARSKIRGEGQRHSSSKTRYAVVS